MLDDRFAEGAAFLGKGEGRVVGGAGMPTDCAATPIAPP